jgi:hypothetical protein
MQMHMHSNGHGGITIMQPDVKFYFMTHDHIKTPLNHVVNGQPHCLDMCMDQLYKF